MSSKPAPHPITTTHSTLGLSTTTLSNNITHLTRTLSTASGLDATLATACYTSLFLSTQLPHLSNRSILRVAGPRPNNPALKALYTLLEDHRIISRLWGLIPLSSTITEAWRTQHRDPIVRTLLFASLGCGAVFQVLENVALLTQYGVFRGEGLRRREGWCWVVSNRWWLAQLVLEVLRLARVRQLKFREELGAERVAEDEKEEEDVWVEASAVQQDEGAGGVAESTRELVEVGTRKLIEVQSKELEKRWWRDFYATVLEIPLALHWSFDEGLSPVSEAFFAACGMVAGVVRLQDSWEETA